MTKDCRTLNLGCGRRPIQGAVNHDRRQFAEYVDVWWDLEELPWPNTPHAPFAEVHARDVLEHISPSRFYPVMDEIWGLLAPGGLLHIQVPKYGSENATIDPTHWRGFHLNSFDFLDPTTRLGKAGWTTDRRWKIVTKIELSKTNTNLQFLLKKL